MDPRQRIETQRLAVLESLKAIRSTRRGAISLGRGRRRAKAAMAIQTPLTATEGKAPKWKELTMMRALKRRLRSR